MNKKVVSTIAVFIVIGIITITALQLPAVLRADSGDVLHSYLPIVRRSFAPQLVEFVTDLVSPVVVTDIVDPGDGRLFIATRDGRIQISAQDGTLQPELLLDIRDRVHEDGNEMGLVGLATHPDYASNGYIYVYYTELIDTTPYSVLARYTVGPSGAADPATEQRLLHFDLPSPRHHGGSLQFGPLDGYLYISVGDGDTAGDSAGNAQSRARLLGKILRIDVNNGDPYAIPQDNPFVADVHSRGEIWALGFRNPWRISFDSQTGDMYIGDVGEFDWEEIDFIPAGSSGGQNFGWPCMEGPVVYRPEACEENVDYIGPIFSYPHIERGQCSVISGYVYRGSQIPELSGHFLFADLCSTDLWSLKPTAEQSWEARNWGKYEHHFTTFGERSDGELFLGAASNKNIYQIIGLDQPD